MLRRHAIPEQLHQISTPYYFPIAGVGYVPADQHRILHKGGLQNCLAECSIR